MLALAQSYKVSCDVEDGFWWFAYILDDSIVSQVGVYDVVNQGGAFTQAEVRVVTGTGMALKGCC